MEQWKEIYGFSILFEVSNRGRVRTKYDAKRRVYSESYIYMNPLDNGKGYLRFNWRVGQTTRTVYVHRLVAEAFIPNPKGYSDVNHKDEDKTNNSVDNLEWCDHRYNCNYGTRNIRAHKDRIKRVMCIETGVIYTYAEVMKVFNVGKTAISHCVRGKNKTCAGFHWREV